MSPLVVLLSLLALATLASAPKPLPDVYYGPIKDYYEKERVDTNPLKEALETHHSLGGLEFNNLHNHFTPTDTLKDQLIDEKSLGKPLVVYEPHRKREGYMAMAMEIDPTVDPKLAHIKWEPDAHVLAFMHLKGGSERKVELKAYRVLYGVKDLEGKLREAMKHPSLNEFQVGKVMTKLDAYRLLNYIRPPN